jgi:hypothetical protein
MALGNANFDTILSTTLKHYTPKLEDNIFNNSALLYWLKQAGNIEAVAGGESAVEPLLFASNSTAGTYAGYDNIATTPQDGITAATYDWKQFAVTVAISGIEEAKNSSKEQIISLLKAKVDQAEMSATDVLNAKLWANPGTTTRDPLGIAAIVSTTAGTTAAFGSSVYSSGLFVGNIDSSATGNAFWQNQLESTTEALALTRMSNMWNNCSKGTIHPEFIITSQLLWEKYESLLQPALRYSSPTTADAGFQNLLYKTAPILWEEKFAADGTTAQVGDTNMYFLNSKFLKLKTLAGAWFKNTPFEKPHGQDAKYSQILSYFALTANDRRFLGVLTNKS